MQQYLNRRYRGPEFQKAHGVCSSSSAPNEPQVQAVLADYGLAVLDELPPARSPAPVEYADRERHEACPGRFPADCTEAW